MLNWSMAQAGHVYEHAWPGWYPRRVQSHGPDVKRLDLLHPLRHSNEALDVRLLLPPYALEIRD